MCSNAVYFEGMHGFNSTIILSEEIKIKQPTFSQKSVRDLQEKVSFRKYNYFPFSLEY